MRLIECLRMCVQDVDFAQNEITVRDGKGAKDRRTMLPGVAKRQHDDDRTHVLNRGGLGVTSPADVL